MTVLYWLIFLLPLFIIFLFLSIRQVSQFQMGILFRLGKVIETKGPGLVFLFPLIERMPKVDLRTVTMEVPGQDVITKDNVSIKVSAVIYFKVVDAVKSLIDVEDYQMATSQLAQTTLRSICGQDDLDHLLSERDAINKKMQVILDQETEPWGVKISKVEVKEIDLPENMQRAMAKQAEAERERRAAIINADGEYQSASKLCEAASLIDQHPAALQLRYLQTIREIGTSEKTSTLIPVPLDLLKFITG